MSIRSVTLASLLLAVTVLPAARGGRARRRRRQEPQWTRVPIAGARLRRSVPRHAQDDERTGRGPEPARAIRFPGERRRRHRLHGGGVRVSGRQRTEPGHRRFLRQARQRLRQGQRVALAQAGRGDHRRARRLRGDRDGDSGKGKLNHLVDVVPAGDRIYMLVSGGAQGPRHRATMPSASAIPSTCSAIVRRRTGAIGGQSAGAVASRQPAVCAAPRRSSAHLPMAPA